MKKNTLPDEGLRPLASAVISRARAEAEEILAQAATRTEKLLAEPHERARQARASIIEPATREAKQIRQRAAAAAELEAQNARLKHREDLLNAVFEATSERFATLRQTDEYSDVVRNLTLEALGGLLVKRARILADAEAHSLLAGGILEEVAGSAGVDLVLGSVLENRTGVVVETLDGHRLYDNTLEARLERQKDALRAPVYRLLTGESG